MTPISILFGKNGSGKSLILREWRDKEVETCHYVVPERSGAMIFQPQELQEQISPAGRKSKNSSNFSNNYRELIITRIQAYFLVTHVTQ